MNDVNQIEDSLINQHPLSVASSTIGDAVIDLTLSSTKGIQTAINGTFSGYSYLLKLVNQAQENNKLVIVEDELEG